MYIYIYARVDPPKTPKASVVIESNVGIEQRIHRSMGSAL